MLKFFEEQTLSLDHYLSEKRYFVIFVKIASTQ